MLGHYALSEFAFSEFGFVPYVPPPAPPVSTTDGYSRQEAKRYKDLVNRLNKVTKVRDRVRRNDAQKLRDIVTEAIDPKPIEIVGEPQTLPKRKTLSVKSLPDLNSEIYRLELEKQQMDQARWRAMEYQRLIALEKERQMQRDDEEALLLLL